MSNAITLAQSPALALAYCNSRRADTEALVRQLPGQTYVNARHEGGEYFIGEMKCAGLAGMLAYILKKFW